MNRQKSVPVFKPYVMNQMSLLPHSYADRIPAGHLVRLVNEAIEALDLEVLLASMKAAGPRVTMRRGC
jgi:transposase